MSDAPVTDRLFFALRPDPNAIARIGPVVDALKTAHALRGPALAPARWHVTLCFLGDHPGVPPHLLAAARAAGDAVAGHPAFDVAFDHAESFVGHGGHHPLVLRGGPGLEALKDFRERLAAALVAEGVAFDTRPFVPHLTLLRDRTTVPSQPVAPVTWRVERFQLLCSRIGRAQHDALSDWPLG